MSFDPRSLERLKQLGRQLPQPLEAPEPKSPIKPQRQHRVETEQDPQELFRQLMEVSPDGNVPEHLMARMRELEQKQKRPINRKASAAAKANRAQQADDSLYSEFEQMLLEEDDD